MTYLVLAALAAACTRTDLGHAVDCGEGVRAVVNHNEFCVYEGQSGIECPEALPFAAEYAGASFCAVEEHPHPALLAAALATARAVDAGLDAGPDLSFFDALDGGGD